MSKSAEDGIDGGRRRWVRSPRRIRPRRLLATLSVCGGEFDVGWRTRWPFRAGLDESCVSRPYIVIVQPGAPVEFSQFQP